MVMRITWVAAVGLIVSACSNADGPTPSDVPASPTSQASTSTSSPTSAAAPDDTSATTNEVAAVQQADAPEDDSDELRELSVTHPIAELDAMWASQPYAANENAIGIQFHNGVDYFVTEPQVTVLSAVSGTFQDVQVMERQPDGAFQVNLMIIADGGQVVSYSLEPSAGPADEAKIAEQAILSQQMLDAMTVERGDRVEIGQPIGVLLGQDEWAHVHMTVKQSNSQPEIWLCPMDYMAAGELDVLSAPTQAWADRLYNGTKTPELCNF